MKLFIYDVAGTEFVDTEAFGAAWKQARALATEKHCAIYRTVRKGEIEKREVLVTGGCFLSVSYATDCRPIIF